MPRLVKQENMCGRGDVEKDAVKSYEKFGLAGGLCSQEG